MNDFIIERGTVEKPVILARFGRQAQQGPDDLYNHVHSPEGACMKNRWGPPCVWGESRLAEWSANASREAFELPPTKQREGDQALPTHNDEVDCQTRLINRINSEIPRRREVGIQRYGTALQPFNGRNALRDLWEELADASTYFMQVDAEYEALVDALIAIRTAPYDTHEREDAIDSAALLLIRLGRWTPDGSRP